MTLEEIGRYDPYTDKFLKNTTFDRVEIGTDGNLYRLSISNGNEFLPIDRLYTKADMVAMLTEIQLELDEMKITKVRSAGFAPYSKDPFRRGVNCSKEIIQQKINTLKADSEVEDGKH